MTLPDPHRLADRYFDRLADGNELAELDRALREDPRAAEAFALAARLHAGLVEHFAQQARPTAQSILARAVRPPRTAAPKRTRLLLAVAAGLILVAGAALWRGLTWPAPPARVVSGQVLVAGQPARNVPAGAALTVPAGLPAVLTLDDGSQATFAPGSEAVLHGPRDAVRQLVELTAGAADFDVPSASGGFAVQTALGRVHVKGTRFSVRLIPATPEKGNRMKTAYAALAVTVLSGLVEVQIGPNLYTLGPGQSQAFAKDGDQPKTRKHAGELSQVGNGSITILRRKDRGESSQTLTVDAATKVLIETDQMESVPGEGGQTQQRPKIQDGSLADLKVGQRVEATCDLSDKALTILVRRPPAKRGGEGER